MSLALFQVQAKAEEEETHFELIITKDALIQVVDAAGTTDIEGNPIGTGQSFEDSSTRVSEEITF